jgi:hypothetical protein
MYKSFGNLERLPVSCESLHDMFNQVRVSTHELLPVKLNLILTAMSERICWTFGEQQIWRQSTPDRSTTEQ